MTWSFVALGLCRGEGVYSATTTSGTIAKGDQHHMNTQHLDSVVTKVSAIVGFFAREGGRYIATITFDTITGGV